MIRATIMVAGEMEESLTDRAFDPLQKHVDACLGVLAGLELTLIDH